MKSSRGFIKYGVNQNKQANTYEYSPFLESFLTIIEYEKSPKTFIKETIDRIKKDITLFIKCSQKIHKSFRMPIQNLSKKDKDEMKEILNSGDISLFMKQTTQEIIRELPKPKQSFSNTELVIYFKHYQL